MKYLYTLAVSDSNCYKYICNEGKDYTYDLGESDLADSKDALSITDPKNQYVVVVKEDSQGWLRVLYKYQVVKNIR